MSRFGYVLALDLHDARAVLVGGGPEAVNRLEALLVAGATVDVITPTAVDDLLHAIDEAGDRATLHVRDYEPGDLVGARIAIATREDPGTDVAAFWAESRERHVLTSVLDDLPHTDFAQPALVRRGDLRIAVSTGGTAPALARRYREDLEDHYGPEHAALVEAAADARDRAGRRPVAFAEWAGRWSCAVWDLHGLARRVRKGDRSGVVDHLVATLLPDLPIALQPHPAPPHPRPTRAESDRSGDAPPTTLLDEDAA